MIGYGNIAPTTNTGKIATIFYAIIGMPLFLLYLSNIGNLLLRLKATLQVLILS
jgi:potassium channel subfamily K member 18